MPLYLSRFSYTPETWARLISNPEDRRKAAQTYIESVGGKLHGFWYAFGTHDGYTLWEAPDNVSMAAVVAGDRWRRRAQLARDDGAPDRRRDDGGPAQGQADPVPTAGRVALARRFHSTALRSAAATRRGARRRAGPVSAVRHVG